MPAPEVLAHHPFTRGEEVEGGSQPYGSDLLLGHQVKAYHAGNPQLVPYLLRQGLVKVTVVEAAASAANAFS